LEPQTQPGSPLVWLALAAAILLGCALRLAHHGDVEARSPDEYTYTGRAQRMANEGMGMVAPMFREYLGNNALWIQPPVTRLGNVFAIAAAMKITGKRTIEVGAYISLACSILYLLLVAWIGIRFFNPWIAVSAVTFQAFSLGALGIARRAWGDGFFGLVSLLVLYLTLEITRNPRRIFLYPLFFFAGTYAMLTKETSVMSYGLCGLWLVGFLLWKERWWKGAALVALGGVISVAAALGIWASLAGGVHIVLSAFTDVKVDSDWGRLNAGGPWWQLAYLLWIVGPLTAAMAIAGIATSIFPAKVRARLGIEDFGAYRLPAVIFVSFLVFASLVGTLQYLRILSPADGPYCLLAGLGLWNLLTIARRFLSAADFRTLALVMLLAVAIEGVRDYQIFTYVVVRTGMQDLTATWIRNILGR